MNCKSCGMLVSAERLVAVEDTELCHDCSEPNRTKRCVRCRELVGEGRAEALPESGLCIGCVRAVGSDLVLVARQVRTSKEGSMKINYGGVDAHIRRRYIEPL